MSLVQLMGGMMVFSIFIVIMEKGSLYGWELLDATYGLTVGDSSQMLCQTVSCTCSLALVACFTTLFSCAKSIGKPEAAVNF